MRQVPGHLIDLVPTVLDIAGGKRVQTWAGQAIPQPPGKSLVPSFAGEGTVAHESLWWWHEDNRALRAGDWKIVAAGKNRPWELYDLRSDRAEMNDLATQRPEKVRELAEEWTRQMEEFSALARKDLPAAAKASSTK